MAHRAHADAEKMVKRNPHPDFKKVEAERPDWEDRDWRVTKTRDANWKFGQGGNDNGASLQKEHIEIDPYEEGRPAVANYKLLISAIIPRPVGFCSTVSKDGQSTNLAPFSYFQVVNSDPPIFIFGFAGGFDRAKDTLRNLVDTGECCVNIVSEHYIEAANATAINAPHDVSEWALTGLHPTPCTSVKASRVKEAVFSVEGKLMSTQEFKSKSNPDRGTGVLALVEGVRFWAREDAINEDRNMIDPNILRPMSRLGGITYAKLGDAFEIPRPDFDEMKEKGNIDGLMLPKAEGQ